MSDQFIAKITGRVRGLFSGNYPENKEDEQFLMNNRGDQLVAQSLPELTEVVRLGESYQVIAASGIAPLTAAPTTTAGLSLYNGEPATGKCYAIDSFGVVEIVTDATQQNSAALFAMKDAFKNGSPILLEPIMLVENTTPEEYQGDIMGDLNRRRGKIASIEVKGNLTMVQAEVPLAEMFGYATAIHSLSKGRSSYSMEPSHFEQVPQLLVAAVLDQKETK